MNKPTQDLQPTASKVTAVAAASETPTTQTNWSAFDKAKLVPSEIRCEGYYPVHPHNNACHTRIKLAAETMLPHITGDHGNNYGTGFKFTLKPTDGKPWKGFSDLAVAGIEASDFRCDVCDEVLRFQPQVILKHMKPHSGKTRRTRMGGEFWLTLTNGPVQAVDEESEFFDEA